MNKLLIITNTFTPGEGGRSERLLSRVRYLLQFNWKPVIFVPHKNYEKFISINNEKVKIYGVETKERDYIIFDSNNVNRFVKFLSFPDSYIFKVIPSLLRAKKIATKESIDALYTMNFPFSIHLFGLFLKKVIDIPWLAEFRDAWVKNPYHFGGEANIFHKFLERKVVEKADKILWNYGVQMEDNYFATTYPDVRQNKFKKLNCPGSCGFDFDRHYPIEPIRNDSQDFVVTYGGGFWEREGLTPIPFLRAMTLLDDSIRNDLKLKILGEWKDKFEKESKRLGLKKNVETLGWLSYKEFLRHISSSDVLLLIIRRYKGDELNVPQKVVDYIAAKKPILALAKKEWETSKFIEEYNLGISADPDRIKEISEKLKYLYERKYHYNPPTRLFKIIDAEYQTREFSKALKSILKANEF